MSAINRRELFQLAALAAPAFWLAKTGQAQAKPELSMQALDDKLTLLSGAGGNIAILRGANGLLMIDSGLPDLAEATEKKAMSVGAVPIATLINTHFHFDHVGGNERLGRHGVNIVAHENVLKRLSALQKNPFFGRETPALAPEGRPKVTFTKDLALPFGGEKLACLHVAPAHTDGDATIHFTEANVYHTGDLLFNGFYPFIDYVAGGSIEGMVAGADTMLGRVDTKTKIIPGHGPLASKEDLRNFRAMLADINERVSKLVAEGKTLAQAQAAEPTKRYDEKWGKGFLKPADFVRLLYLGKTARA
ncbi:MAG: MBL fold metallo-hydrolase [Bryobacteraceae bacterium]